MSTNPVMGKVSDVTQVYPVYILSKVAKEIFLECKKSAPKETLGRLLGYRMKWQEKNYIKIVDWISGSLDSSHIHACFTPEGSRECECFLDERYSDACIRPKEIGLFHSHPFGIDPLFSNVDYGTFLNFPYDQEGNVFILIDPLISIFKTYIVFSEESGKKNLKQVEWIYYYPNTSY